MTAVTRVLCFDHEGGHGGSSISLFHLLRHMDQRQIRAKVICRKKSDIQDKYNALGIKTAVEPDLPLFSPSETGWKQNLSLIKNDLPVLLRNYRKFDSLAEIIENDFDLVHFNHVSLFALAARLRRFTTMPFSMHIRTRPEKTILTRFQSRSILRNCHELIYITRNEQERFKALAGKAPGTVILNPTALPSLNTSRHPRIPNDNRLKIVSLKGFRPSLGHTRLVDIARTLAERNERDKILFIMAGNMRLWPSLPGELGRIGARGGDFETFVDEMGLSDFFLFLGWVPDPDRVLAACDLLAVPSTENNPWGRDVIDAYSFSKPVLATGSWDEFVKDGETGLLAENFDVGEFTTDILRLFYDRDKLRKMGEAGKKNISALCSPPDRAYDLQELWRSAAHRRS